MASIEYISINGYTGFESVTVSASMDSAARTFSAVLAAELGVSATNAVFAAGNDVEITTNGELLVKGVIDSKRPRIAAMAATITINGRSNSRDLIDSSAMHDTGYFENKDPLEIGNDVAKGIKSQFKTDQQLKKLDQYKLQWGESCFRCVEKMARAQGFTVMGTADGDALITKAGTKRQGGQLIEGVNIKEGSAEHNVSNRHSKITVRGQRPFGHDDENLWIEQEEEDSSVKGTRPLLIIQDEDTDKDRAKTRAKNRKDRAAGNGLKATILVQGFHDDTGQLWEPGNLVWTESPFLDLAQDMLIESVEYYQDEGGSLCTLGLVDPRAYGGNGSAGSGNKSGSEWKMG